MLSRVEAFAAQGVTLKDPERSWSGVREDGGIVIAVLEADVHAHASGFSCLLWAPPDAESSEIEWNERRSKSERREHCRIAAMRGSARALLVRGADAFIEDESALVVRVENCRGEFWAHWGHTADEPRLARARRQARAA
jgi:hypothetical protein